MDFVAKAMRAHNRQLDTATVSKVLKLIFKNEEKDMIKTIFEEREAIGEARGEAKAGRNMVLTALRKKFTKVPKGIEKAVLAMSDPIALESLLEHAIDSNTLDEFAAVVK